MTPTDTHVHLPPGSRTYPHPREALARDATSVLQLYTYDVYSENEARERLLTLMRTLRHSAGTLPHSGS